MENSSCYVCQKPKATLKCGICEDAVCKCCAQFIEEDQFSFLPVIPKELQNSTFCGPCFDSKVAPEIENYEQSLIRAKALTVFFKADSKETRKFKRIEKPLKVRDCEDREETLMRLAFLAVHANFNAIIDVDIISEKVRSGAYQTMKYSGTAMPVSVIPQKYK